MEKVENNIEVKESGFKRLWTEIKSSLVALKAIIWDSNQIDEDDIDRQVIYIKKQEDSEYKKKLENFSSIYENSKKPGFGRNKTHGGKTPNVTQPERVNTDSNIVGYDLEK